MGLFSGIGKFFKKIWDGITKIFEPILKPVGKLLDSSIGKAIMLGVTVFSMGSALLAGGKAFLGAEGFLNKFVQGGKAFMDSLLGGSAEGGSKAAGTPTEGAGSIADQTSQAVQQQQQAAAADMVSGGVDNAVAGINSSGAAPPPSDMGMGVMQKAGSGALKQGGNMTPPGGDAGGLLSQAKAGLTGPDAQRGMFDKASEMIGIGAKADNEGNWLSKAAKAAMDFAKSDGGGMITGKLLEGAGNYYGLKDQQRFDDRIRRGFMNPNDPGLRQLNEQDYSLDVPGNLAGGVSSRAPGNVDRPVPTVPFQRTAYQNGG